jgi:hypothetical protein
VTDSHFCQRQAKARLAGDHCSGSGFFFPGTPAMEGKASGAVSMVNDHAAVWIGCQGYAQMAYEHSDHHMLLT